MIILKKIIFWYVAAKKPIVSDDLYVLHENVKHLAALQRVEPETGAKFLHEAHGGGLVGTYVDGGVGHKEREFGVVHQVSNYLAGLAVLYVLLLLCWSIGAELDLDLKIICIRGNHALRLASKQHRVIVLFSQTLLIHTV